jgi:hypothetical protein
MEDAAHEDEEELGFVSIAAATANVLRYLELTKEQQEHRDRNTGRERDEKQKTKDERDYINHRLRELAAWERRIDGNKKRKV